MTPRRKSSTRSPRMRFILRFSAQQQLRPVAEVAAIWNARSGQRISKSRVQQILRAAETKLAEALRAEWMD